MRAGLDPVRAIALFEAGKAVLVLAAASGLLALVHADLYVLATDFIAHSHLNPAAHVPQVFLEAARHLQNTHLQWLAAGAAAYAAMRAVEAWGLWHRRAWAEVFAAGSGAIYLPIEVIESVRHPSAMSVGLLVINAAIVAAMVYSLWQRRRQSLKTDIA